MEKFFLAYPDIISILLKCLLCIVGILLSVIGYFVKTSIAKLNKTLEAITTQQKETHARVDDIESRLSTQETICDVCRRGCPYRQARNL